MNSPFRPKSANFFARLFVATGLVIFILLNASFYLKGNEIKQEVSQQAQREAAHEVANGIEQMRMHLNQLANEFALWDEVRQQLSDASYYFYWRDQSLKQTSYFHPYYEQVELYYANGNRVAPISKSNARQINYLPNHIEQADTDYLFIDSHNNVHFLQFKPIYSGDNSQQIMGYVGISSNFLSALFSHTQFFFTQKNSLHFEGAMFDKNRQLASDQIISALDFSPVENPINEYLWHLIKEFMIQTTLILLVLASLFFWLFSQLIHRPLLSVIHYLQQLKDNPNDLQHPEKLNYPVKEFTDINESIYLFHHQLHEAQHLLNKQNTLLWTQARYDGLTNVCNRRAFDEAWAEVIKNPPSHFAFVLFDCDFFKALNDSYGHEVGDEIIRITAQAISSALPDQVPVYRIGGDEFAIMLHHEPVDRVQAIIQHCLDKLAQAPFAQVGVREKLSFSVGISMITPEIDYVISELPRQADIAMYKAKQSHQHKIQFYCHHMENDGDSVLLKNNLINTVMDAIHTGQYIAMHFQPIASLQGQQLYYESLIRLVTPSEYIGPKDIFAVVNRRRLEVELDKQVLQQMLLLLQQSRLPAHSGVSINLSAKTLLQSDLIELLTPFTPFLATHKLVIEVTETSLIEHFDYVSNLLQNLRRIGFLIALDDFGSGYSSIRYLANMPVDIIKFDISLLHAMTSSDTRVHQIIRSTANMIRNAGYDLVCEGVESWEQLDLCRSLGATHVQGYLIGKPDSQFHPVNLVAVSVH